MNWIAVFLFGALGGIIRYAASGMGLTGTILIDLTGTLLFGFAAELFRILDVAPHVRAGVLAGGIGSLTTFSSLVTGSLQLSNMWLALGVLCGTTVIGSLLCHTGSTTAKWLRRRPTVRRVCKQNPIFRTTLTFAFSSATLRERQAEGVGESTDTSPLPSNYPS